MARNKSKGGGKLSIILSKGTLDMAYPAFMLSNAAALMGYEVNVFFTFWGMHVINKKTVDKLVIDPLGNPAMPMPEKMGLIPGMTDLLTKMMKKKIKEIKIPTIHELIKSGREAGVKLYACSTTMSLMGVDKKDFINEIDGIVGAASFIGMSEGGQIIFI